MKEVLLVACYVLHMNRIIPIVNVRAIFGHTHGSDIFLDRYLPNFSDIVRTRTDNFLQLAPLVFADVYDLCTDPA